MMEKKCCELCGGAAAVYCDSDQASLCWNCDEKVHGANFLVAKHCRNLLCKVCKSSTPWTGSGSKIVPAITVCEGCVVERNCCERLGGIEEGTGESLGTSDCQSVEEEDDGGEFDDSDSDSLIGDSEIEEEEEVEVEVEDGENQVVPWSGKTPTPSPPVLTSSSSEENISYGCLVTSLGRKRRRDDSADLDSDLVETGCSSSQADESGGENSLAESKSSGIRSMKRFQADADDSSTEITKICEPSRDVGR